MALFNRFHRLDSVDTRRHSHRMINSAQEFRQLRTSSVPAEYQRAAGEDAPIEVWREIINFMPDMREWVARNKTVPIEILEILARDESFGVRSVVAGKRKLPESIQLDLGQDVDASVRHSLACNAKATKRVLEILALDGERFISERATKRLQTHDHCA
jgi:hypothetical protein